MNISSISLPLQQNLQLPLRRVPFICSRPDRKGTVEDRHGDVSRGSQRIGLDRSGAEKHRSGYTGHVLDRPVGLGDADEPLAKIGSQWSNQGRCDKRCGQERKLPHWLAKNSWIVGN